MVIKKERAKEKEYLTYHTTAHTKYVINAAEHLALIENISEDELVLLKTAALFHDAGFLQHHHDHEDFSCKIARKHLPDFGFSQKQTETVCRMIMATKLPQTPDEPLAKLLCDADLYYLGSKKYTEVAEKLLPEFKKFGIVNTKMEWDLMQVEFLSAHTYFTKTAIGEREAQKQINLQQLKAKLETTFTAQKKAKPLEILQDALFMIFGAVIAGYALKGFLVPNHFFDGGITGISLLVHELYHLVSQFTKAKEVFYPVNLKSVPIAILFLQ